MQQSWEFLASNERSVVRDGVVLRHRINRPLPIFPHEVVVGLIGVVSVSRSRDFPHCGRVAVGHVVYHGVTLTVEKESDLDQGLKIERMFATFSTKWIGRSG